MLGTLGVAEMVAFAVAHGADSPGPTAVAALCAALQLAALALCRTAYRQVGWRWAGRMPGDGRLRGTELRKRAALCRSRLGAAARFDAVVRGWVVVLELRTWQPAAGLFGAGAQGARGQGRFTALRWLESIPETTSPYESPIHP